MLHVRIFVMVTVVAGKEMYVNVSMAGMEGLQIAHFVS
jgi:hypothetical protein